MIKSIAAVIAIFAATPAMAEFSRVSSKGDFVGLVSGKALTRMGITLRVLPEGKIEGRAFGQPVTGAWSWNGGFFCRDLNFGQRKLGSNCQVVQKRGDTLRFIADEGRGDMADLRIR